MLCCAVQYSAVLCNAVLRALSSSGLGDAIQGRVRREACWGIIIQVLALGSSVLVRCPAGAGELLPVNIAAISRPF